MGLLATLFLPLVPAPAALAWDSAEDVDPFDPEVVQAEPAPLPEVITDAEREAPIPAEPSEIEWSYAEPEVPDTPAELIADGTLLPKEGGPMTDVYAVETADGTSEHAALVYTDVVNRETGAGKWVDLVLPTLTETPVAYVAKANAITTSFPKEMAADSRVVYATEGGELRSVLTDIAVPQAAATPPADEMGIPTEASPSPALEDVEGEVSPSPQASPEPVQPPAEEQAPALGSGETLSKVLGEKTNERTVIYRNVHPATDVEYIANDQGYKENVILRSPEADANLSWDIRAEGFSLREAEDGSILISDASGVDVSGFAVPLIHDSSSIAKETYGEYHLTPASDGNYLLAISIDPLWLDAATYPVIVDPGPATATKYPSRDTTVSSGNNTNYETNQGLWISKKQGDNRRTFIKQDLSSLTNHGRLVYSALLTIVPYTVSDCTPYNDIVAKRVTAPNGWPGTPMTWNNQPSVSGPAYNGQNGADGPNGNSFGKFELKDIYQHYIDLDQPFHWSPQGIRLSEGSNTLCKVASSEVGGGARPTLLVSYNDLPGAPQYANDSIANNETIDTPSPALKVSSTKPSQPNDPNGDDVMFQYQVSTDSDCATQPDNTNVCKWGEDANTGYTSPPTEAHTWSVPSGVLTDGGTHWWRVISVDVCGHDGGVQLCGNKGGDQHEVPYKGTAVRNFKVVLPKLGVDAKWKLWTQSLGNGLTANVNETTGNLNLEAQLESLTSPLGPLGVGLTYNSQSSEFTGSGVGWDLAIGEESKGSALPIRLKQLGVAKGSSIVITFRGGEKRTYSKRDDSMLWGGAGSDSGWISGTSEPVAGTPAYTYRMGDGSFYTFAPDGTLRQARPRGTSPDTSDDYYFDYKHVKYTVMQDDEPVDETVLDLVTDPRGKTVDLNWVDKTEGTITHKVLDTITTWNNDDGTLVSNEYKFTYTTGFKLASITLPTQQGTEKDVLQFAYGNTSGKMCEAANALQKLSNTSTCVSGSTDPSYKLTDPNVYKPWAFEMTRLQELIGPSQTITGPYRVTKATPPASGTITSDPWLFNYKGNGEGDKDFYGATTSESTVAEVAYICDPNSGYTTYTQCAPNGTTLPNNGTQLDFNMAGLPLRIYGPTVAQGGVESNSYAPTSTMLWDSRNQLVCSRTPEANAYELMTPLTIVGTADCRKNTRNTAYEYQEDAPYNEIKVTFPDPGTLSGADSGRREFEKTFYDEGEDFQALWVEGFRSEAMRGLPAFEKTSHVPTGTSELTFNEDWTGQGPGGLDSTQNRIAANGDDMDTASNGWAVRWNGYLDLRSKPDSRKYAFKVPNNLPVTLSVGKKTLFDCAGGDRSDPSKSFNCGGPNEPGEDATVTLANELQPISVTYTHATGTGTPGMDLRWDQNFDKANPNFQFLGLNTDDLNINLGLATRTEQGYQEIHEEQSNGGGGGTIFTTVETVDKTTTYTFDGSAGGLSADEAKRRKIASKITVSAGGDTSVTTNNQFDTYGNPTRITQGGSTVGGNAVAGMTTETKYHVGVDAPENYVACQTEAKDAMEVATGDGSIVTSECDDAGNVTESTVWVDAAPGQPAHGRITRTDFDRANRPIQVTTHSQIVGQAVNPTPLSDARTTYYRDGRPAKIQKLIKPAPGEEWSETYSFHTFTSEGPLSIGVVQSPSVGLPGSTADWVASASQSDWAGNEVFVYKPYPITSNPSTLQASGVLPPAGQVGSCSIYDELGRLTISRTKTTFVGGNDVCATSGLATQTDYYMRAGAAADFRTVSTDASGVSSTTWYDMAGRKLKVQTEDRLPTTFVYDERGNAIEVLTETPEGQIRTTSTYDGFNRVTKTVSFAGTDDEDDEEAGEEVTQHQYDGLGRLQWTDGPRPQDRISFEYDEAGRTEEGTYDEVFLPNPDGSPSTSPVEATFEYNSAGERIGVDIPLTAGQNGTTMTRSWGYNTLGQAVSYTDGRGQVSSYAYDMAGHLVKTTIPSITETPNKKNVGYSVIRLGYNKAGKVTHQYAADATETNYVGSRECFVYDLYGNMTSTYVIDGAGAIGSGPGTCSQAAATPEKTVSVTYDDFNRIDETEVGDWVTKYAYDGAGRIGSVTDGLGTADEATTSYAFYSDQESEPEGALKYVDDALMLNDSTPTVDEVTTYTYDTAGRVEQKTDPAGMTWSLDYEGATGRLDKQTIRSSADKILAEFDPSFTPGGNIGGMKQTIVQDASLVNANETTAQMWAAGDAAQALNADSGDWTYGYDGASRLLSATQTNGPGALADDASFQYKYDGGGNRIEVVAPRPNTNTLATTFTHFDAAGLATTETRGALTNTYAYDVAGALVSRTSNGNRDEADKDFSYAYDPWGRMTSADLVENGATAQDPPYTTSVDYGFDALGRTVSRESTSTNPAVDDTSTAFSHRGLSELITLETMGQAPSTSFVYGPAGTPLASGVAGSDEGSFLLKNTHGDVVGSVSSAAPGSMEGTVAYSPFGERRSGTDSMDPDSEKAANGTTLGFQGQPTDAATGLIDANTRMYDPSMGRFTTIDTVFGDLASPMSLNQYAYGNGNPVTMSDTSGMSAMSEYKAAMREYAVALEAWRLAYDLRQEYLNVMLPGYRQEIQFWNSQEAAYQHANPKPKEPPFFGPPGPKPVPPVMPPVTVQDRKELLEFKQKLLEQVREAAAENKAKMQEDVADYMEARRATRHVYAKAYYQGEQAALQKAQEARENANRHWFHKGLDWANENLNPGYNYLNACFNTDGTESLGSWGAKCAMGAADLTLTAVGGAKGFSRGTKSATGCNSFSADTKVLMADGSGKRMDRINTGDMVAAAKPKEVDKAAGKRVAQLIRHQDSDWFRVRLPGEALIATAHHPFHVAGRGWLEVEELKAGMQLTTLGGRDVTLLSIEPMARTAKAFNFEVADFHTYFVGNNKVLVHNSSFGHCPSDGFSKQFGGETPSAETVFRGEKWGATTKFSGASRGGTGMKVVAGGLLTVTVGGVVLFPASQVVSGGGAECPEDAVYC